MTPLAPVSASRNGTTSSGGRLCGSWGNRIVWFLNLMEGI
ncbi:Uncharacterised protein [Sphingomonas paucimobilis]|jgi:hypothetical protein|nr:Uncharacterised protein [Sphingomonas paucimobilis]